MITEKLAPNCIGYVEYKLGIINTDSFVDAVDLSTGPFLECNRDEAVAVGAVLELPGFGNPLIIHLALIDRDNPKMVTDRWKSGYPIRTVTKETSLDDYEDRCYKIVHLKVRKP